MEKPEISVQHMPDQSIVFSARFSIYAAQQLGLEVMYEAAKVIAAEFLTNPDLQKFIDRDKISQEITAAIGRAFVEKLMGKEEKDAVQKKD